MKRTVVPAALAAVLLAAPAWAGGSLYGTVTTSRGESYTGTIRWDKNENFWDDLLDASKRETVRSEEDDGLDVRILGLQILKVGGHGSHGSQKQFSIPMGHIARITPEGGNRVLLDLKGDTSVRIRESSDIGDHMRGIVVDDEDRGRIQLDWKDVDRIRFRSSPPGRDRDPERLYGTVETDVGEFTGYVVWDKDESLEDDVLDGEENGRDREIPFRNVRAVERLGSHGSRIDLLSGEELVLEGTNDVNDQNRGLEITIPDLGKVEVPWKAFRRATFVEPPASRGYEDFDGGRRLAGTVFTGDGDRVSGTLRWDLDEEYTWESLDGKIGDVSFEILFGNIDRIERGSRRGAHVVLKDGLELDLEGSNDVNGENRGIEVVTDAGDTWRLDWDAFESVTFRSS